MARCENCDAELDELSWDFCDCTDNEPPISNRGVTFFTLWDKLPIPWSCCEVTVREQDLAYLVKNAVAGCPEKQTYETALRVVKTLPLSFACDRCIEDWWTYWSSQDEPS